MSVATRQNNDEYCGPDNENIQNQLIEYIKHKELNGDLELLNIEKKTVYFQRKYKKPNYYYQLISTYIAFTTHKAHNSDTEFLIKKHEDGSYIEDEITFHLKKQLSGPTTLKIFENSSHINIYFPIGDEFVRQYLFECFDVWFNTRRNLFLEISPERRRFWDWRKQECKKRLKLYKKFILEDIPKLEVLSLASPLLPKLKNSESQLSHVPFEIFQKIVNMSKHS